MLVNNNDRSPGRSQSARQDLIELSLKLKSADPEERFEAVGELALHPPSAEVEEAIVQATSDPDPGVTALAIQELAERGHPVARQLILWLLHHPHPTVRFNALRSAGVVDISPDLESAWHALESRRWVDRMAGAAALARAGAVNALPRILALAQAARRVRHYSAEAHLLGSATLLGDKASAELFVGQLSARGRLSRLAAVGFLDRRGRIGAMAHVVGIERLRSAILAGRQAQNASTKPGYARRFDDLLTQLDASSSQA